MRDGRNAPFLFALTPSPLIFQRWVYHLSERLRCETGRYVNTLVFSRGSCGFASVLFSPSTLRNAIAILRIGVRVPRTPRFVVFFSPRIRPGGPPRGKPLPGGRRAYLDGQKSVRFSIDPTKELIPIDLVSWNPSLICGEILKPTYAFLLPFLYQIFLGCIHDCSACSVGQERLIGIKKMSFWMLTELFMLVDGCNTCSLVFLLRKTCIQLRSISIPYK